MPKRKASSQAAAVAEPPTSSPSSKRSKPSIPKLPSHSQSQSQSDDADSSSPDVDGGHGRIERDTKTMDAPPKGIVHPVGYRTNDPPLGRKVRIYADGVFDLFHLGHMRQLQQAKQAFDDVYLIVGVTGDEDTWKRKGLTVLSGKERAESVRHCKWVDEVIPSCPWIVTEEFLEKHQLDYVAHDDIPYGADEGDDIYAPIKKAGKFLVTQRTEGLSTTGIITNIVKDYDKFIGRQFKRGATRQELNVSWIKKNELDIKTAFSEVRDNIRNNWMTTGQELTKELRAFWTGNQGGGSGHASNAGSRPTSPGRERDTSRAPKSPTIGHGGGDFAAGYSLGLVSGVRAWMSKSRRNLSDPRREDSEEILSNDEGLHSPVNGSTSQPSSTKKSGRKGDVQQEVDQQVQKEMA